MTPQTHRFSLLLALCALILVGLSGCGEAESDEAADANPQNEEEVAEANELCPFDATRTLATIQAADSAGTLKDAQVLALGDAGTTYDMLYLRSVTSRGGPDSVGMHAIDDNNFKDCGLCTALYTDCSDEGGCDKILHSRNGDVEITALETAVEGQFSATIHEAIFKEVTVANDRTSRYVPNGEIRCIDGYTFDVELRGPSSEDRCDFPGTNCVGETVPDFSLQNCATGDMVKFSDVNNGKATWIVATAGWCPACHEWIPQVLGIHDDQASNGLDVMIIVGEDNAYGQPDMAFCAEYAARYPGSDLGDFYLDHNGQYSYATLFGAVWPYISESGSFGLPWNAIIEGGSFTYLYADGAGTSKDLPTTLEDILGITFPDP